MNFTDAEAAFLLSTKVNGVILLALQLADVYNDLRQLLTQYSDRRDALTADMAVQEEMEGTLGGTTMPTVDFQKLIPKITAVNTLFQALASKIDQDHAEAKKVFEELKAHCEARFGPDFPPLEIIEPAMPTAEDVAKDPEPPRD